MMKLFQRLLDFVFGVAVGLHLAGIVSESVLLATIVVTAILWIAADLKARQIN